MAKNNFLTKPGIALTASILSVWGVQAYDLNLSTNLPPMTFHGFASQGFLYSSDYNYLGDTTRGSFNFSEIGLNTSFNPFPRTRIAAQGFCFDVGNVGQYDLTLDYALIEYTVSDTLGVRAGRLRRPGGIYNHIQDVDLARTWVLLPQGAYDARWRDFSENLDGISLFGSVPLSRAGSLSYEAYAGMVNMVNNGGVARKLESAAMDQVAMLRQMVPWGVPDPYLNSIDQTPMYGLQLWYNTPLDGLRLGACFLYMQDFGYSMSVPYRGTGYRTLIPAKSTGNLPLQQYSVEYQWKAWTFQAEYATYNWTGHQYVGSQAVGMVRSEPDTWYASASYRFNKWFEAGAYYTEFYSDVDVRNDASKYQKDLALSFRFDPKDWWVLKIEGHYIHGTGLVNSVDNQPSPRDDRGWFMLALKTTFSF